VDKAPVKLNLLAEGSVERLTGWTVVSGFSSPSAETSRAIAELLAGGGNVYVGKTAEQITKEILSDD
jgi:hypothetical protein